MKFTLESTGDANLIRGWEAGALRINDDTVAGDVVVSADTLLRVTLGSAESLDEAALEPALALRPEVLLVGTGARQRFLAPALMQALARRGVGVEVMDTLAAARTYNVLVGEGRRVVAALIAPS
ncbi:MAG: MTH938/NDUFAF3 family protein [Xanthomonadaceae bacterium]|nr:MTH938/NDUFAF3 family protein [Xanthomonadaceae bacterium]